MPLWGNVDYPSGNQKPVFANTTNATSSSTIHGADANTAKYYGIVAGVSTTEEATSTGLRQNPTHSGWVSLKIGTGPIASISVSGGAGINANGFLIITDTSVHGQGTGANVSFVIANSLNTIQNSSSNSTLNTIVSLTVVNGGSGYSNASAITVRTNGSNTVQPTFTVTLGGRAGRIQTETLVAMGTISGDDPRDNVYYSGV